MLEILGNFVFFNDHIDLDDTDSDIISLFSYDMGLLTIDLNKINLNDDNFDEDDPETIGLVTLIAWRNRYKQCNICNIKIKEKFMLKHGIQREFEIGV